MTSGRTDPVLRRGRAWDSPPRPRSFPARALPLILVTLAGPQPANVTKIGGTGASVDDEVGDERHVVAAPAGERVLVEDAHVGDVDGAFGDVDPVDAALGAGRRVAVELVAAELDAAQGRGVAQADAAEQPDLVRVLLGAAVDVE